MDTRFAIIDQAARTGRRTMMTTKANDADAPKSFEDARQNTLVCGFLLACHQTLLIALRDRRLHQKHRGVLAVLIEHMNRKSGMAWPGRELIGRELGITPETVSNALRDLTVWGYILAENRRTPETANRSLRHYTLAGLSRAELERQLSDAIAAIKRRVPKAVVSEMPAPKVTARSDCESHRPQCLSTGTQARKSPPAVDESHRPQWTVTNKEEPVEKYSGDRPVFTAAHAHEASHRITSIATIGQLIADDDLVTEVLARLQITNPSKAQRDKVIDTLTKAALQWKGMGRRHSRYQTARDWLVAEWLPRLRDDLDKLAASSSPRRFKTELERQMIFGRCSPQLSLTRDGINAQLDEADKLTGNEAPAIVRDFEACKMDITTIGGIPRSVAIAALKRCGSDPTRLSADHIDAIRTALPDVDPGLLNIAIDDIQKVSGDATYHTTHFGYEGRSLLLRPSRVRATAIAACRLAVAVLEADRLKQLEIHNDRQRNREKQWIEPFYYRPSYDLKFPWPTPSDLVAVELVRA